MTVAPLAIDLFVILACLGALILILCAKQIVTAFFQVGKSATGWIPWVGKRVAGSLDKIEQRLVSALSDTANGLQGVMGAFWHALGNMLASIGNEIVGLAKAIDQLGGYMHGVVRPWVVRTVLHGLQHGVKGLRHELANAKTQVYRITRVIEHPAHTRIGGAVRTITRPFVAALHHIQAIDLPGLRARTKGLEDRLAHDIAGVRSLAREAERVADRAWARVKGIDRIITWPLSAALVASIVGKLGGGWIFCRNWKRLGRGVCRSPAHLINDLLGLIADFVVLTNICQVLPWLEAGASTVAGPIISTLSKAGAGLCQGSSGPAETLAVPTLHLPSTSGSPTLHLP